MVCFSHRFERSDDSLVDNVDAADLLGQSECLLGRQDGTEAGRGKHSHSLTRDIM